MKRQATIDIISFLLILLWSYAAVSKLMVFADFRDQLLIQPVPKWSVDFLHWALPLSEIALAIFLAFQRTRLATLLFSFFLMAIFTVYVALAMSHLFGPIPCSCGGIFRKMGWPLHFIVNLFFTIIAFIGWKMERQRVIGSRI